MHYSFTSVSRLLLLTLLIAVSACTDLPAAPPEQEPRPGVVGDHLTLGNPSGAVADPAQPDNYLISRPQYALSYNRDRGIPNWVSWSLSVDDLGDVPRYSGQFITDTSLPNGWYRVNHRDYSGSGYDRGHMTPSADRSATAADNEATFILSNVLPQAPENNQGLWSDLEEYSRSLVREGNVLYIVSGGAGTREVLAGGALAVPEAVWKVILITSGETADPAQFDASSEVIAIWTPNDAATAGRTWEEYATSVTCIEERTGLDLLSALPDPLEAELSGPGCDGGATASDGDADAPNASFNGCAEDPNAARAPNAPVRIVAIDKAEETVTLQNVSAGPINLDGWVMCSIRGSQQHPIGGTIAAGETRTFPGPSNNIWSNEESDDGALYDPLGRLISYQSN